MKKFDLRDRDYNGRCDVQTCDKEMEYDAIVVIPVREDNQHVLNFYMCVPCYLESDKRLNALESEEQAH